VEKAGEEPTLVKTQEKERSIFGQSRVDIGRFEAIASYVGFMLSNGDEYNESESNWSTIKPQSSFCDLLRCESYSGGDL
jgi:hypothetical protein